MDKEKPKSIWEDEKVKDAMNTMNEAEAQHALYEWFGALFFYCIKLGKTPFEKIYIEKYSNRNAWTAWALFICLIALFVWMMVWYSN